MLACLVSVSVGLHSLCACWFILIMIANTVCCRKLAVYDHWSGLVIHIAMDNCVIVDDICTFCICIDDIVFTFLSFFDSTM